jgi:hypothetical protein
VVANERFKASAKAFTERTWKAFLLQVGFLWRLAILFARPRTEELLARLLGNRCLVGRFGFFVVASQHGQAC